MNFSDRAKLRPHTHGPRPYRIVMVDEDGTAHRWTSGFKTWGEADRLNARPDEYRYGQTAEVRGPS